MTTDVLLSVLLAVNVAAAAATLAVIAARPLVRRLAGAGAAYALWLALPAAAAAMLLPKMQARIAPAPAPTAVQAAPPAFIDQAWEAVPLPEAAPGDFPWLLVLWLAGVGASLLIVLATQFRFQVLARRGLAGPAVSGMVAPRIVTPADFERRFSSEERELILAHERAHLSRQDARINGALTLLQCLNWFNPLLHLAAYLIRLDQELACDAAVMARHPGSARRYAETMLKTQTPAARLPLGCYWPARGRHPLERRIALLKARTPGRGRRLAGFAGAVILAATAGYTAYAAQPAGGLAADPLLFEAAMGRPDAPVTITEWASPSCPVCARGFLEVLPELKARYIDTGLVRYEYREIATAPQDLAVKSALAARCAGKDRYFDVMADIYARREDMMQSGDFDSALRRIAARHGVSDRRFDACVLDPANLEAVGAMAKQNLKQGWIQGTPTYWFSTRAQPEYLARYNGLLSLERMEALITAASEGVILPGPGLQTSTPETGVNHLPQAQIDALSAEMRASGFAPPQAAGIPPDRPGLSVHGALLRGGQRREFGLTGAAATVNILPMGQDAAMALAVTLRDDVATLRTLVALEDQPVFRGPIVSVKTGERATLRLPRGEVLELQVYDADPAPVRVRL